jgi:hypothetical protein
MPLMVVDGAAGDSKGEHEFRDVVGGKVISGFSFGEICGRNDYVRIRRLSGKSCWLFYEGKVYRAPVSVELLQLFVRNPIYLGEVR